MKRVVVEKSGVVVVDKPQGPTSHDVVERVRRRFKPLRVGHVGTLDPFATGVLVLVFNQATRVSSILGAGDKLYRGRLVLGVATDTADPTGQVVQRAEVGRLEPEQVRDVLKSMEGVRYQKPHPFSAAKHKGRPLYYYARRGLKVEKPPRQITIHRLELVKLGEGEIWFEMLCSKGTYVRAVAEEMARALGTVGHLGELRRVASAPFGEAQAVELGQLLAWSPQELEEHMIPVDRALEACGLPAVVLDEDRAWELRQGRILPSSVLTRTQEGTLPRKGPFRVLDSRGQLVAVLRWLEPGQVRPGREYETIRVFRPEPGTTNASASAMGAE